VASAVLPCLHHSPSLPYGAADSLFTSYVSFRRHRRLPGLSPLGRQPAVLIPIGFNLPAFISLYLSAFMNTFLDFSLVPSGFPSYPWTPLHILGCPFVSAGSPSHPWAPLRTLTSPDSSLCLRRPPLSSVHAPTCP